MTKWTSGESITRDKRDEWAGTNGASGLGQQKQGNGLGVCDLVVMAAARVPGAVQRPQADGRPHRPPAVEVSIDSRKSERIQELVIIR